MDKKIPALVISGFPGIGKSHFFKNEKELQVLDSDSSSYSWESEGVRHPDFPANYIAHIKDNIDKADVICVSSHDVVRSALKEADIAFYLVHPARSAKEEYLQRFKDRESPGAFLTLLDRDWDAFITSCETAQKRVILGVDQYLSDIVRHLLNTHTSTERSK